MEDPALMTAAGAPWGLPIPSESVPLRQYLYLQMWVSFMAGNYAISESSEASVRHFAANELFRSSAGRNYWEGVGQAQIGLSKGRRNHFFRILDEEYHEVLSSNIPTAVPVKVTDPLASASISPIARRNQAQRLGLVAAAAVAGALAGRFWRRSSFGG